MFARGPRRRVIPLAVVPALGILLLGCDGGAARPASCRPVPATSDASAATTDGVVAALSVRQQQAIGRVDPDVPEQATRDLLFCSGTMIAPGWVLTAAHCALPSGAGLLFLVGEDSRQPLATWPSRRLVKHPTLDLLVVELEVPGDAVDALVEPIAVASAARLVPGQLVALAGFGMTQQRTFGERRSWTETLVDVAPTMLTVDGFGKTGACTGDSGGPLLARGDDGAAHVVGALHGGSADCLGRDRFTRLDVAADWIRNQVGGGGTNTFAQCQTIR